MATSLTRDTIVQCCRHALFAHACPTMFLSIHCCGWHVAWVDQKLKLTSKVQYISMSLTHHTVFKIHCSDIQSSLPLAVSRTPKMLNEGVPCSQSIRASYMLQKQHEQDHLKVQKLSTCLPVMSLCSVFFQQFYRHGVSRHVQGASMLSYKRSACTLGNLCPPAL